MVAVGGRDLGVAYRHRLGGRCCLDRTRGLDLRLHIPVQHAIETAPRASVRMDATARCALSCVISLKVSLSNSPASASMKANGSPLLVIRTIPSLRRQSSRRAGWFRMTRYGSAFHA